MMNHVAKETEATLRIEKVIGVRPSPGAESTNSERAFDGSKAKPVSDIAAPEDGRTPISSAGLLLPLRTAARSQRATKQATRIVIPAGSCQAATAPAPLAAAIRVKRSVRPTLKTNAKTKPARTQSARRAMRSR